MRKISILFAMLVGVGAMSLIAFAPQSKPTTLPDESSDARTQNEPVMGHHHDMASRVPSFYATPPRRSELKPTLAPELFEGNIRLAYQAVKDIPETLAQIPCYCHCDMSKGHRSLHSCFVDEHGSNCGICIGEAVMVHNLSRQRLSPAQIREQVIKAYGQNAAE